MEDSLNWWQIAQLAGAGGCLVYLTVITPAAIYIFKLLWQRNSDNEAYIRESDKSTLTVLNELTKVLQADGDESARRHGALLASIDDAIKEINRHIDERTRSSGS